MKKNLWLNKMGILGILFSIVIISCNKDVDAPIPNTFELPKGPTIGVELSNDPSYSLLLALVSKVGLTPSLLDSSKIYTVFAPDNAAIKTFVSAVTGGLIPAAAPDQVFLGFINAADPATTATLRSIVNYHILPGQALRSSSIGEAFANTQYPTGLIFPPPNTNPLARFTTFVSRRQNSYWVNNIPVAKPDYKIASNGLVHGISAVLTPPTRILLDTISKDSDFTYLVAAIQRADSGLSTTAAPSFQYFLSNPSIAPAANFTIFAPTNQAFRELIAGLIISKAMGDTARINPTRNLTNADTLSVVNDVNRAIAAGPAFLNTNNVTTNTIRGILAYHVIANRRAFNVNFATTATDYPTFLNSTIPSHPGVKVTATIQNGFGAGLKIKGLVNASEATAAGTALGFDRHAVNGVFYKINQVLLPVFPPSIVSFSPMNAKENDVVTITGINLLGTTSVRFGGIPAKSFEVVNETTIRAIVDKDSESGNVDLQSPRGFAFKFGFTFTP
jgi:uncharacterized surface protein with fasciclin (FAS1) repeats